MSFGFVGNATGDALRADDQQMLNAMTTACKLPKKTVYLLRDGHVVLQPSPYAKFEAVDCLLRKLKDSKFSDKLGFIGSEAYTEEPKK